MFDCSTKITVINLKEFTVNNINCPGWESNLSIHYSTKLLCTQFQWAQASERLSWKMTYSMILGNNTKWVSRQVFRCGRAKLGPLARRYLHHVMLITEFLLVLPAGHMDPHYQIGSLNLTKCPELATNRLECEPTNLNVKA